MGNSIHHRRPYLRTAPPKPSVRECARCHESREIVARDLCARCYEGLRRSRRLGEFGRRNLGGGGRPARYAVATVERPVAPRPEIAIGARVRYEGALYAERRGMLAVVIGYGKGERWMPPSKKRMADPRPTYTVEFAGLVPFRGLADAHEIVALDDEREVAA